MKENSPQSYHHYQLRVEYISGESVKRLVLVIDGAVATSLVIITHLVTETEFTRSRLLMLKAPKKNKAPIVNSYIFLGVVNKYCQCTLHVWMHFVVVFLITLHSSLSDLCDFG